MDENGPQPSSQPHGGIHHFSSMTTIILLVVFILLAAIIGYAAGWSLRDSSVGSSPTTSTTATTSATSTTSSPKAATNQFNVTTVKVGDKVGSMTVTSVAKAINDDGAGATADNYSVEFSGTVQLTGTYEYLDSAFSGPEVCIQAVESSSLNLLPVPLGKTTSEDFCFTNQELAKSLITTSIGSTGKVTFTIDQFTSASAPAEVGDTAQLKAVITKS